MKLKIADKFQFQSSTEIKNYDDKYIILSSNKWL